MNSVPNRLKGFCSSIAVCKTVEFGPHESLTSPFYHVHTLGIFLINHFCIEQALEKFEALNTVKIQELMKQSQY